MKTFKIVISSYQTTDIAHGIDMATAYKAIKDQITEYNKNLNKLAIDKGFIKAIISIEEVKEIKEK